MNQMYPQYAINPAVGGQLYFDPSQATDVQASKKGATPVETFQSLMQQMPGVKQEVLWDMATKQNASVLPQKDERAYIPQYPGFVGPNSYPSSK
jgi:hypothetical protein